MMTFQIHRGTNISHWLSQSQGRGQLRRDFFTEADVQQIAGWGMDHLRLPIDEEQMWTADGQREAEAFDLLNQALDWADKAGLRVVVDLHILRSHYFNDRGEPALFTDPAELEKLINLWRDLSAFMRARSTDKVAYEMLNESVAHDPQDWNRVAGQVFRVLRELEPKRTIVLGSNQWNQVQTYPDLVVPDDPDLILTFHYYNPMFVTHYRAGWTDYRVYPGPIQYPGQPVPERYQDELRRLFPDADKRNLHFDREVIKQHIMIAAEVAQRTGHPLYCGEFGVYQAVPLDIKLRWYRDIISVFDELGIAWANWDYRGGFGIVESYDGKTETGIRAALMGNL
jgi:endoglucanase